MGSAARSGYDPGVTNAEAIDETIESIAELERRALADASRHQRAIERLTRAVGRPRTLYLAACASALWVAFNAGAAAVGIRQLDPPPFAWLSMVASVASLLTTLMILVTANRADALGDRRERLTLQIALLTDRKTAKIIALLEELRRDSPAVRDRPDPEAAALSHASDPHAITAELEKRTPAAGSHPAAESAPAADAAGRGRR
jgi:uncharacterized membrane protein